ncbi:MAG: hypothetical protein AVDCRST_MAG55-2248, partial [uncultured Rubrobacteraceae bacterium]
GRQQPGDHHRGSNPCDSGAGSPRSDPGSAL